MNFRGFTLLDDIPTVEHEALPAYVGQTWMLGRNRRRTGSKPGYTRLTHGTAVKMRYFFHVRSIVSGISPPFNVAG